MYRNPGTGSSSGLGSASGVGGSSGGGDREARLRQEQQERLLESGNDSLADSLHTKVSKIKSVTIQMHGDMEEDNRSLDDMGNSFDSVGNQIKRTVNKLQIVMSQPHTRQTFMIAGGIMFVFFIFLMWSKSSRAAAAAGAAHPSQPSPSP